MAAAAAACVSSSSLSLLSRPVLSASLVSPSLKAKLLAVKAVASPLPSWAATPQLTGAPTWSRRTTRRRKPTSRWRLPGVVLAASAEASKQGGSFDGSVDGSADGGGGGGGGGLKQALTALTEPLAARTPVDAHPSLINEDFAPTLETARTFRVYDLASLWIGLVVCVPTYYLAGSLVELGMSWWQGVMTVFLGNVIVLLPMVLTGHPGTKYGIPFPVLARASFGVLGANIPSLLRALVACGWFGIQTWVGGTAIHRLAGALSGNIITQASSNIMSITASQFACFMIFWAIQVAIIVRGIESIRQVEEYAAPVLIAMGLALLAWAYLRAGGFGSMLSAPSQFAPGFPKHGKFWPVFFASLTANVGFWATLSLNIPDFTRYARSQTEQLLGQAIGLPLFMALFTFIGLAVTSATVVIFGHAIPDPIELLSRIRGLLPTCLSLIGLLLATLSTNIAANVVAPANALVNLAPNKITFRTGGLIAAVMGVAIAPWRLISSTQGFIYTWLIGYSALLGPVGGIVITDYFLLRRRMLDIDALYSKDRDAAYWYAGGINPVAVAALVAGVAPNIPGFLQAAGVVARVPSVWANIYIYAWFVGFFVASVVYYAGMRMSHPQGAAHKTALAVE